MRMPRRTFLASGLIVGASTALLLRESNSVFAETALNQVDDIPYEALQDPLITFTASTFKPYVGGYFQTRNSRGEVIALKLLKVKSFDPKRTTITTKSVSTDSFSLFFSSEARLPQFTSIYRIEHSALGQFDLFLTPRTGLNGELFYEAVFNHTKF